MDSGLTMYEIVLRVQHDCPYSRIANLFDVPIYEICSDLYDLLIIPQNIDDDTLSIIRKEIRDPESLEIYFPDNNKQLIYLYFTCMCNWDINIVPTVERLGGIIQYPIRYEDGYEYYKIINLNAKTQSSVLKGIEEKDGIEILEINTLGINGIFKSQFLPVNQLINSLTERQIEVIVLAYQKGYYEIPRRTRTKDLADDFGVSRPATEKSLRNAENQILENVIPYLLLHQKMVNNNTFTSSDQLPSK